MYGTCTFTCRSYELIIEKGRRRICHIVLLYGRYLIDDMKNVARLSDDSVLFFFSLDAKSELFRVVVFGDGVGHFYNCYLVYLLGRMADSRSPRDMNNPPCYTAVEKFLLIPRDYSVE